MGPLLAVLLILSMIATTYRAVTGRANEPVYRREYGSKARIEKKNKVYVLRTLTTRRCKLGNLFVFFLLSSNAVVSGYYASRRHSHG